MCHHRSVLAVPILLTVLSAASASAAPPLPANEAQARALTTTGLSHYQAGEYDQAIAAFKAAHALVPIPLLLFNIGQAYRLKGEATCGEALTYYREFLRTPGDVNHALAREHAAAMEQCLKRRASAAAAPPPASAVAPPSGPASGRVAASPPAAGPLGIAAEVAPPEVAPVPPPPPTARRWQLIGGLAATTVGLGLTAVGIYQGTQVAADGDEVTRACQNGCTWDARLDGLNTERDRHLTQAIVFSAIGGALTIGGGVLTYLYWARRGPRTERPQVAIALDRGQAGIRWTGTF